MPIMIYLFLCGRNGLNINIASTPKQCQPVYNFHWTTFVCVFVCFFSPGNKTLEKYFEDWTFIIQEDGKPLTASLAGPSALSSPDLEYLNNAQVMWS